MLNKAQAHRAAPSSVASVVRTHVGHVRRLNEDRALDRPGVALWAVADGMGGHAAGDVAATIVVEELAALSTPTVESIAACLEHANEMLLDRAAATGQDAIATTVVVLGLTDTHAYCVWSGDSRAYLFRAGRLSQITRDHSLVQDLVEAGRITAAEARTHPQSHVVTQAVGVDEVLGLETTDVAREPGDVFLLCSDGLTGMLTDGEIAELLQEPDLAHAAGALVLAALDRGGLDNVTLALVRAG